MISPFFFAKCVAQNTPCVQARYRVNHVSKQCEDTLRRWGSVVSILSIPTSSAPHQAPSQFLCKVPVHAGVAGGRFNMSKTLVQGHACIRLFCRIWSQKSLADTRGEVLAK